MTPPPAMNGVPLTPSETALLHRAQSEDYRDPHTQRTLGQALAAMKHTRWWPKATEAERAERVRRVTRRYHLRGAQAAYEPRSPLYMREAAHRTARIRLEEERANGSIGGIQHARRWSQAYHLAKWDSDVIALHDATFA